MSSLDFCSSPKTVTRREGERNGQEGIYNSKIRQRGNKRQSHELLEV